MTGRSDGPLSLSIIVGARGDESSAAACLESLYAQLSSSVELLLVEDSAPQTASLDLPPSVRRFSRPGGLVPQLWAEGIDHASGEIVGLLAATVVPADNWVACTLALHRGDAVGIGGAIEPGERLHAVDWAVYFCRYAPYLRPIAGDADLEVPGDNASYRREILVRYRPQYENGFWEPAVHRSMRADGHRLSVSADRVVTFDARTDTNRFCRQRYLHGRAHGEQRSAGLGRRRILLEAMTFPIVPLLLTLRVARTVMRKRRFRGRFVAVSPLVVYFYCWWAAGELAGRLASARRLPPA